MNENSSVSAHAIGIASFCPRLAIILDRTNQTLPVSKTAIGEKNATVDFNKIWTDNVSPLGTVNLGRLEFLLKEAEGAVLESLVEAGSREKVLRSVQNMRAQVSALAGALAVNGHVTTDALFNSYFGGTPEFNQTVEGAGIRAPVDIVARQSGATRVWRFIPEDGLGLSFNKKLREAFVFEASADAVAWENAHSNHCDATVVFEGVPRNLRSSPNILERIEKAKSVIHEGKTSGFSTERCGSCDFHTGICANGINGIKDTQAIFPPSDEDGTPQTGCEATQDLQKSPPVGRIIQNLNRQLAIQIEKKRLCGYLYEDKAEEVHVGEILTAISEIQPSSRLLCRVVEAKSSKQGASIPTKSVEGFVCYLVLEPVGVSIGQRLEEVPNANYDGYVLHRPSSEDFSVLYNLPAQGIPLGYIATPDSKSSIPYRYDPFQAFKSFFVCGGQGTGKTNFLRYFIRTWKQRVKSRPAIVVLDVEGQFANLQSSLHCETTESSDISILRVGSSESPGDVTLSFRAVGEKYLSHFVPELPTRTTEMLERTTHDVFVELAARGEQAVVQRVLREISTRATRDGKLHFSQRDAILRAAVSPTFNLFDQPDTKPLAADDLLVPGRITVIDASEMSEDDQRVVAIYLMAILFEAKMKNHNEGGASADVLLIVDEAHRLFPQHRGLKRDYVMRVAKFVEEVTHRGRKRNYGILLATQSPGDISQSIVGLCETKLFFRVAGHQTWLKEHVGNKEVVKAIGNLPNFQAYIIVKGSSREPVAIGFPNVSDGQTGVGPL
jgi:DNA helicase HerA-like ATPase